MKGKISDWKDDKGFGFIRGHEQSDKIFFHISDIKTNGRRPKIDDLVEFEIAQDSQKRLKAKNIVIESLPAKRGHQVNYSNVAPPKKTILDCLSIAVLFISIGSGAFIYYKIQDVNKIILLGVFVIISVIIFLRKKTPKEKAFTCARCKSIASFDKRTIQAWNAGFDKLYCIACHKQWLEAHSQQQVIRSRQSTSGCLGIFVLLLLLPILMLTGIYTWFS
ncbi:putative Cold-shock DNA-binding domain family protein [Candidatus Competibacter denitrificans Run_A_D11]|uniref:Cold-shock DNA-binding domain family protein n=1 Tax=Candidatus Competibacter denitrificans Run_A_D11 TaxID=1400863 RepID=W6M980_9GAMM|nr:cold shock domain-containing protein [Candidatus Competibacter denitrificans]CDI03154.1 putative Cold-shock DNA-binding domain family protein [Candidatus Competibacter denitrificans Run_A_D11]